MKALNNSTILTQRNDYMCQYSICIAITEILPMEKLRHFTSLQDFLKFYNKILFINVFTYIYIKHLSVVHPYCSFIVALHWLDSTEVKAMEFFFFQQQLGIILS